MAQQAAQHRFSIRNIGEIEKDGNPCYPSGSRHSAVGSFERCTNMVERLVDHSHGDEKACPFVSCSFDRVFQPTLPFDVDIIALENFFYVPEYFNLLDNVDFLSDLERKGRQECSLSIDDVQLGSFLFLCEDFCTFYLLCRTSQLPILESGTKLLQCSIPPFHCATIGDP
jgi:hypothetical protein